MRICLILLIGMILSACSACTTDKTGTDSDLGSNNDTDQVKQESDDVYQELDEHNDVTETGQKVEQDNDIPDEDIDMFCPSPENAGYPYTREDGTLHFCRGCDTPTENDPKCIKSLWDDLNKEIYEKWKANVFENNDKINECYPYPCEWDVKPQTYEDYPEFFHKCDKKLNPYNWENTFTGPQQANLDNGKIGMWIFNGDIQHKLSTDKGYGGDRVAYYDISQNKFHVVGVAEPFEIGFNKNRFLFSKVINRRSYMISAKLTDHGVVYDLAHHHKNFIFFDTSPGASSGMSEKWVFNSVRYAVDGNITNKIIYSRVDDWDWTELAEGKAIGTNISGDKVLFAWDKGENTYICDLSTHPKSINDCTIVGEGDQIAAYPLFDKDDPSRVVYWKYDVNGSGDTFVIIDITEKPFKVLKEFKIPITEEKFTRQVYPFVFKGNILGYREEMVTSTGTQYDNKICFYRLDENKTYCSVTRPNSKDYKQGYPAWEGKYLFWQGFTSIGFWLRDMECYCKEEGAEHCPFDEYRVTKKQHNQ